MAAVEERFVAVSFCISIFLTKYKIASETFIVYVYIRTKLFPINILLGSMIEELENA